MDIHTAYQNLGSAGALDSSWAAQIVKAARPHALAALGRGDEPADILRVSAVRVEPSAAQGGSVIPAWPSRESDGSVRIAFVDDWGVMLAAWRASLEAPAAAGVDVDQLLQSGERIWVGIANDVLQLNVVDPPPGTYSMVRHHGLMLAAATIWLGPGPLELWRAAHECAALSFVRRLSGRSLWQAIDEAERGLDALLANSRSHAAAPEVIDWLDTDRSVAAAYADYLGAASLGVAALLAQYATDSHQVDWVQRVVRDEHPQPEFNRLPIERFVAAHASGVARLIS